MQTFTGRSCFARHNPAASGTRAWRSGGGRRADSRGGSAEFVDKRPESVAQRRLIGSIDGSPRQQAQERRLVGAFGAPERRRPGLDRDRRQVLGPAEPITQTAGVSINDNDGSARETDLMGVNARPMRGSAKSAPISIESAARSAVVAECSSKRSFGVGKDGSIQCRLISYDEFKRDKANARVGDSAGSMKDIWKIYAAYNMQVLFKNWENARN